VKLSRIVIDIDDRLYPTRGCELTGKSVGCLRRKPACGGGMLAAVGVKAGCSKDMVTGEPIDTLHKTCFHQCYTSRSDPRSG